ncbi:MAG: hypothetical protein R3F19_12060 [Verrucomicrobiales bacterium]
MKTVYGMAKCYLNLGGSRARNFELDFLRLALVAERDADCVGVYLAAPLRKNRERVELWNAKYGGSQEVQFVHLELSSEELVALEAEKSRQDESNRSEADAETRSGASASYGETLCEDKLAKYIAGVHPTVTPRRAGNAPCLSGIRWDYFGNIAE